MLEHNEWSLLGVVLILYDFCMTTKKSYKSYMIYFEIQEICMMGDPGIYHTGQLKK